MKRTINLIFGAIAGVLIASVASAAVVNTSPTPFIPGPRLIDGSDLNKAFAGQNFSTQSGIVAHAGGGSTSAYQLIATINKVDTVATANDSVILPKSSPGLDLFVVNNGANTLAVYPNTTNGAADTIQGVTTQYSVGAGQTAEFLVAAKNAWFADPGATGNAIVGNGVNQILLNGAATGVEPSILVGGPAADTNIGIELGGAGTGSTCLGGSDTTCAASSFEAAQVAGTLVNHVIAAGTATGTSPTLTAGGSGSDTNVSLTLVAKGSGSIVPKSGISAASQGGVVQTISPRNIAGCNVVGLVNNTATANAASTDVYITEIYIPANISTTGVAVLNGTTAANNNTIYLADVAGNQVAHTASTAVSGTSQYQLIPWASGPIAVNGPGTYYLYFTNSGTTNTWETINNAACGTALVTGATYGTFKSTTPPTTFTAAQGPIGSLY